VRYSCPHCFATVKQAKNREGPNFCPHCQRLFSPLPEEPLPAWIWGVLVFLTANWQIQWISMHRL